MYYFKIVFKGGMLLTLLALMVFFVGIQKIVEIILQHPSPVSEKILDSLNEAAYEIQHL